MVEANLNLLGRFRLSILENKYKVTVIGLDKKPIAVYRNQTRKQVLELEEKGLKDPQVLTTNSKPEK